ncbi:MAG: hypothetical protein ACRDGS_08025, partial [Chloroflexota bacterium]
SGSVLGGLAVTAHNSGALSTAAFDSVRVTAGTQPTTTPTSTATNTPTSTSIPPSLTSTATNTATIASTPTSPTSTATSSPTSTPTATGGSCPSGWSCNDIGNPALAGSQALSGSTWTIQGGGYDIWLTMDQFHYVWQPLAGDGSLSARATSQSNSDPWAKAGVMLRQTTDPASPFYALFVTPGNGIVVDYRSSQGSTAIQAAPALAGAVPAYLKVTRSGSTFSAFTSSDGTTWTLVPGSSLSLTMSGSVLSGLAVTAHNGGAVSTASFDSINHIP